MSYNITIFNLIATTINLYRCCHGVTAICHHGQGLSAVPWGDVHKTLVGDMWNHFYRRNVDDILIIFDTIKTNEHTIQTSMNMIHPLLHFTPTTELDNVVTYLDLTIHRLNHTLQLGTHHKPTQTDATVHFMSIHPTQHKLVVYLYHINRMLSLPITEPAKNHEWNLIRTTARNNGFPSHINHKIKNDLTSSTRHHTTEHTQENLDPIHFA
jgi:hypothetical protein